MSAHKITKQFTTILAAAGALVSEADADAILVLLDGSTDWQRLRQAIPPSVEKVIVAADLEQDLAGAADAGLIPLPLNKEKSRCWKIADGFAGGCGRPGSEKQLRCHCSLLRL